MAEELGVDIVKMSYVLDGVGYKDGDMPPEEFYAQLRRGKTASTSQIGEGEYTEFFTPYLQDGKDIVYLAFSSGMSGSHDCAVAVAERLRALYPERRIAVIDSKIAMLGEGLYLYHSAQFMRRGASFDELVAYMLSIQLKMYGYITPEDLTHLRRGGRIDAVSAVLGGMLNIKPVIMPDRNGVLVAERKVRGRKASLDALASLAVKHAARPQGGPIFIAQSACPEAAEELKAMLAKHLDGEEIIIGHIGAVIGAHTGPGALAVFFVGREERHGL
jgi:DegV family protein with EDD domain